MPGFSNGSGPGSGTTNNSYDQGPNAAKATGLKEGAAAAQRTLGGAQANEQHGGPTVDSSREPIAKLHWSAVLQSVMFQINGYLKVRCPKWAGSTDEIVTLSTAWGNVLEKYFPDAAMDVEESAAIATMAYLAPRALIPDPPVDAKPKAAKTHASRGSEEPEDIEFEAHPDPSSAHDARPSFPLDG